MQNNYQVFNPFQTQQQPQFQPQKKENFLPKLKDKFANSNKTVIAFGIVIIFSGVMVGMGLRIRAMNANNSTTTSGQVEGDLTEATPAYTLSPTDTPYPTADPNQIDETPAPADSNSEGYIPTEAPVATVAPTVTASPTPSPTPVPTNAPDTYNASISNVATGNPATITVNVTKNNNNDCGESVSLVSDPTGVNFTSNNDCSNGNTTFSATAAPGTYHIYPEVYNTSYGSGTDITF